MPKFPLGSFSAPERGIEGARVKTLTSGSSFGRGVGGIPRFILAR